MGFNVEGFQGGFNVGGFKDFKGFQGSFNVDKKETVQGAILNSSKIF